MKRFLNFKLGYKVSKNAIFHCKKKERMNKREKWRDWFLVMMKKYLKRNMLCSRTLELLRLGSQILVCAQIQKSQCQLKVVFYSANVMGTGSLTKIVPCLWKKRRMNWSLTSLWMNRMKTSSTNWMDLHDLIISLHRRLPLIRDLWHNPTLAPVETCQQPLDKIEGSAL